MEERGNSFPAANADKFPAHSEARLPRLLALLKLVISDQVHPADAHAALLLRKDTTMLELERIQVDYPEANVDLETGDVWFDGPNGRVETLQEYEARMLQNKRMRFHRSFSRNLAA